MLPALVNTELSEEEILIGVYCTVCELVDHLQFCLPLLPGRQRKGPESKISHQEMVTLGIFKVFLGFGEVKQLYHHLQNHYADFFPNLPCYRNFTKKYNESIITSIIIMKFLMLEVRKKKAKHLHFMDSSPLCVCKNIRIPSHKVAKAIAARGKNSMGWFYGFKIHMAITPDGYIEDVIFTPGNVDDRPPARIMAKGLFGNIVTDAGYVGIKWTGIDSWFTTAVKKTMKRLMSFSQHKLFKQRQYIETLFGVLKYRMGMASSLPRSICGYFSRYMYTLLAYSFLKMF